MENREFHLRIKVIRFRFFRTKNGREPVKDFIKAFSPEDRKAIGAVIKKIEFDWPLGKPACEKLAKDLWECRVTISENKRVRIFFTVFEGEMIGLHAIVKKQSKVPKQDIETAKKRMKLLIDAS